jgi:hypothetical protein
MADIAMLRRAASKRNSPVIETISTTDIARPRLRENHWARIVLV